jgi:hypothetical protein
MGLSKSLCTLVVTSFLAGSAAAQVAVPIPPPGGDDEKKSLLEGTPSRSRFTPPASARSPARSRRRTGARSSISIRASR